MTKLLSIAKIAELLGPSASYIGAVVEAMHDGKGPKPKWHDAEKVREWIVKHPDFRVAHVRSKRAKRVFQKQDEKTETTT
jgi:hypothetical protein